MWAAGWEKGPYNVCDQRSPKSACASAQSDQGLRCSLFTCWSSIIVICINNYIRIPLCGSAGQLEAVICANVLRSLFASGGPFMKNFKNHFQRKSLVRHPLHGLISVLSSHFSTNWPGFVWPPDRLAGRDDPNTPVPTSIRSLLLPSATWRWSGW